MKFPVGRAVRGHRGADELGGDDRRGRIVEIEFQLVCPEGMDVAAEHDRVGQPGLGDLLQGAALPRRRIAVPVLRPVRDFAVVEPFLELGHQLALRPRKFQRAGAVAELAVEPGFLRLAEIRPARVEALRAGSRRSSACRRRSAACRRPGASGTAARRRSKKRRQRAEIVAAENRHVRPARPGPRRQRHVLPECLIRRRAALQEDERVVEILRPVIGVIVLHLVVVPDREAGRRCVQRLEVRVGRYCA